MVRQEGSGTIIEWKTTQDNNVEVLNETADYHRNFDAFKGWMDDEFEMPDKMVAQLVRILEQNHGKLSDRAKNKEFTGLSDQEIHQIENKFKSTFKESV